MKNEKTIQFLVIGDDGSILGRRPFRGGKHRLAAVAVFLKQWFGILHIKREDTASNHL